MKRRIKFDMSIFNSLESTKNTLDDGNGGYCSQGKVIKACGLDPSNTKHWKKIQNIFLEILISNGWQMGSNNCMEKPEGGIKKQHVMNAGYRFGMASHVNNKGEFQAADQLALQSVIESGMFKIVNCVESKELVKTA